jgi:flagellar motor switch protein FliG
MSAAVATPAVAARLRKAAIVLCALPDDLAARVLEHLPSGEVDALTDAVSGISAVDRVEEQKVCIEYLNGLRRAGAPGGTERARSLIQRAFEPDEAARHLARLEGGESGGPFGFIDEVGVQRVLPFLREEHPQTLALICACTASRAAAAIVTALPNRLQRDVLRRVASLAPVSVVAANAVSDSLERRVVAAAGESRGGVATVERILSAAGNAGAALRRVLEADLPELGAASTERPLTADSLAELLERTPTELRGRAIATIPSGQIARALRAAPPELGRALVRDLPEGKRAEVRATAQSLGPVKVSEAERGLDAVRKALRRAGRSARKTGPR